MLPPCNGSCVVPQLLSHVSQAPSRPVCQNALLPCGWHFWSRPTVLALGRNQSSGFPYWQQCQLTFLLMGLLQFLHTCSSIILPGEDTLLPHMSHMFSGKTCMSSCSFIMSCVGHKWVQKDAAGFGSGELFGDPSIPGLNCAHLLPSNKCGHFSAAISCQKAACMYHYYFSNVEKLAAYL